jgi:hypothetical protein
MLSLTIVWQSLEISEGEEGEYKYVISKYENVITHYFVQLIYTNFF